MQIAEHSIISMEIIKNWANSLKDSFKRPYAQWSKEHKVLCLCKRCMNLYYSFDINPPSQGHYNTWGGQLGVN